MKLFANPQLRRGRYTLVESDVATRGAYPPASKVLMRRHDPPAVVAVLTKSILARLLVQQEDMSTVEPEGMSSC